MNRTFRIVWGLLTLLACGWIAYGLLATGAAFTKVVTDATMTPQIIQNAQGTPVATRDPALVSAGTAVGATIGGGLGVAFFLCTGLPLLLIFGFLYWRNGVAMRRAKEHAETIEALKSKS